MKEISTLYKLPEVSGENLVYSFEIDYRKDEIKFITRDWGNFKLGGKETVPSKERAYLEVKKKFLNGELRLTDLTYDDQFYFFTNHLIYDLFIQLKIGLNTDQLLENLCLIIKSYLEVQCKSAESSRFGLGCREFLDLFEFYNRFDLVRVLVFQTDIGCDFSRIHQLEYHLKEKVLNSKLLFSCFNIKSALNGIVANKIESFNSFIDSELEKIYAGNYSFYQSLFGDLLSIQEINQEFPTDYEISPNLNDDDKAIELREGAFQFLKNSTNSCVQNKYLKIEENFSVPESKLHMLWNNGEIWLSHNESPLSHIRNTNSLYYYVENSIQRIFISFVFNLQNNFRKSIGLPNIGEGWVSETNLFNCVNEYFEELEVIQHASPTWLGRQHLDIFIPEYNLAIEYQGKQHSEPVEFFGGIEGFEKTVERDLRKKKLCKENNCSLFYVYPETDIDKFIVELEKYLKR
jgi:hypothetical protein